MLTINVEQRLEGAVVRLTGDVDLSASPQLRSYLKELVRAETPRIIADMGGVSYIDSSGVATLVECLQGVSRYGGRLRLAALNKRTLGVFEISRLDTVFSIHATVEEALRA